MLTLLVGAVISATISEKLAVLFFDGKEVPQTEQNPATGRTGATAGIVEDGEE